MSPRLFMSKVSDPEDWGVGPRGRVLTEAQIRSMCSSSFSRGVLFGSVGLMAVYLAMEWLAEMIAGCLS